jgi:predicted TPR repeat methyltransferase
LKSDQKQSLSPEFFHEMYAETHDPWGFETRSYEAQKYAATLDALPREHYRNAFEIGCSIGVLTEQLAARCGSLLAVDVVENPLEHARRRCRHLPQVDFRRMQVPEQFPEASFDLIVLSEVGYYWSGQLLDHARDLLVEHLEPRGHLVMVHWRPFVEEYPLRGDDVHDHILSTTGGQLRHLTDRRQELYRLDVLERL